MNVYRELQRCSIPNVALAGKLHPKFVCNILRTYVFYDMFELGAVLKRVNRVNDYREKLCQMNVYLQNRLR